MKKTLTVNLNNIVFHIDDDAYEMLQTYLADVARHLSEDEKKEVMNDIEARVAELFTERLQRNKNVVNIEDVEEIIKILGKPSQYADEDENDAEASYSKSEKKRARRFFRDPENAVFGGVGAGIAAYFTIDVTWVRIVLVILALISAGYMIPIYILVWIIAPKAVTVSQRLEMQGEDVTVESIKTEINNVKNYVESDKFKQSANSFGDKLGEVLKVILKVIVGFFGAIFGVVGMIIVGVLLLLLLFFIFEPSMLNGCSPEFITDFSLMTPDKAVLLVISLLLVVGCPIFMLIYWALRIISGRHETSRTTSWVVFILWIAGIFMLYSVGARSLIRWSNTGFDRPWVFSWENDENLPLKDENRTVDAFNSIEISGNIELELQQDSVKKFTISASEQLLPYIKTEVRDGKLSIYTNKVFLNRRVKVFVANDSVFALRANGASHIKVLNELKTSKLSLELTGASQAHMIVDVVGHLDAEVNGASYADIDGKAGSVDVEASGASKIDADQLISTKVTVEASGASNARVFASETVDADASGASRIECTGSPKNINRSENMGSNVTIK